MAARILGWTFAVSLIVLALVRDGWFVGLGMIALIVLFQVARRYSLDARGQIRTYSAAWWMLVLGFFPFSLLWVLYRATFARSRAQVQ